MMKVVIIAMLCATSLAQSPKMQEEFNKLQASKHQVPQITSHSYAQDCWEPAHLPIKANVASLLQGQNVPGAGIDKFKPFETVLKDGFLKVKCVKDYMYYRGDKFGDNKHDYKLGQVSNVSIVHYDAFVAKEDRAEMTQKKCFEFCRTVPNMGFFGIVNGRGCYCTPYFTPMASDSSQCDAQCEGDNTLECGGKSKSSVFAMHMCDSTKEDLGKSTTNANSIEESLTLQVTSSMNAGDLMQRAAADLQKRFGQVGDSSATGLCQSAKEFAGDLIHKAEEAGDSATKLGDLSKSASSLSDFTKPATVTKAERVMEAVIEAVAESKVISDDLAKLESLAAGETSVSKAILHEAEGAESAEPTLTGLPDGVTLIKDVHWCPGPNHWLGGSMTVEKCAQKVIASGKLCKNGYFNLARSGSNCYCMISTDCSKKENMRDQCRGGTVTSCNGDCGRHTSTIFHVEVKKETSLPQYKQAMYFVDKKFEKVPMTCSGDLAAKPITDVSKDSCAAACDANLHSCVGFQYFSKGKDQLCFLLSNFKTGFYYTGCGGSFLQTEKAPFEAECYAKFSKFGTDGTLAPNPSGKCKQCFTDLTKANRCFK